MDSIQTAALLKETNKAGKRLLCISLQVNRDILRVLSGICRDKGEGWGGGQQQTKKSLFTTAANIQFFSDSGIDEEEGKKAT